MRARSSCNRAGDLRRAEESIDLVRATVLTPLHGWPRVLHAQCLISYAAVLHKVGRWAEAEAAVTEALSDTGSRFQAHRVDALCLLAELRIEQGRVEEAAALVEPHADDITVAAAMARVHLCRGDGDEAAALLRRALRMLRGDEVRAEPLAVLLVEAELARVTSMPPGPRPPPSTAGSRWCPGGASRRPARSGPRRLRPSRPQPPRPRRGVGPRSRRLRVELAEAEAAVGDRAEAAVDARIALRAFEGLGRTPGADRARAVLRSLGVREAGGRRPHPSTAGLSAREAEVLDLLRLGLTNAEIGSRLFISAKTAEHHVGRILTKLGVRSRAEAAARGGRGRTPGVGRIGVPLGDPPMRGSGATGPARRRMGTPCTPPSTRSTTASTGSRPASTEIAPPAGFTFNQFLVRGDEPLLFHTGMRGLFPLVSRSGRASCRSATCAGSPSATWNPTSAAR